MKKSVFAVLSWVLSIIAIGQLIVLDSIYGGGVGNRDINDWISDQLKLRASLGVMFFIAITGLILGIIGLFEIKKDSNISGKVQAIIGIIVNILLSFFSLVGFLFFNA